MKQKQVFKSIIKIDLDSKLNEGYTVAYLESERLDSGQWYNVVLNLPQEPEARRMRSMRFGVNIQEQKPNDQYCQDALDEIAALKKRDSEMRSVLQGVYNSIPGFLTSDQLEKTKRLLELEQDNE